MYTFCKISKFVKVLWYLGIIMSNHITLTEKKGNPSEYSEATANIPIMQMWHMIAFSPRNIICKITFRIAMFFLQNTDEFCSYVLYSLLIMQQLKK